MWRPYTLTWEEKIFGGLWRQRSIVFIDQEESEIERFHSLPSQKTSSLTSLLSGNTFNNHRLNLQVTNTVIMWYHIYSVRRSMFIITEQFLSGIYSFETRLFPFLANRMFLTNWNKMVRSYNISRLEVKVFRSLRLKDFLHCDWRYVCEFEYTSTDPDFSKITCITTRFWRYKMII